LTIAIRDFVAVLALAIAPCTFAQTAPADAPAKPADQAAPAAAPAPTPPPSAWTKGGIDIYLYGDGYGDLNFNHPEDSINQLYNFNTVANQFRVSFAKVAFEKASGVFGFRIDAGDGTTVNTIYAGAAEPGPSGFKYLEQLYGEFRPPNTHGLEIDFGKFNTSVGAEVIEAGADFNYSRSLLFTLGSPYYHFGVKATLPVTKDLTVGVQLVNGWNSVGNENSFETVGLVGNYVINKKVTWNNTFLTGPQSEFQAPGVLPIQTYTRAYINLYDTNFVITANDKTSFYAEYLFGTNKLPNASTQKWTGLAGAARYQITPRFAAAGRLEWYDDINGFDTGVAQSLAEVTVTGEMKIIHGLLSRLEYRHDSSAVPYFNRGTDLMVARGQSTVALALIASFGPK
jgi:hypothetical protein